ncbi:MAG: hypothetical protein A2Z25_01840 [Planctomycetes bacterium RBG_16_55_9]|nr:MAG: hypothetical protein A2Z25_01840 [Planctomycetes bacterium RBG_16_55_9]
MKRITIVLSILCWVFLFGVLGTKNKDGVSIQDGILKYSEGHYLEGQPLVVGYDPYGYNYQGHRFDGSYVNAFLGLSGFPPYEGDDEAYLAENPAAENHWTWPYRHTQLTIKWNDAWLSNKDRDGDGELDRHFGYESYVGSGAWATNHMSGGAGKERWTYFAEIVAVVEGAECVADTWYRADGTEIGPVMWGDFAAITEVERGAGITRVSQAGQGLSKYTP